MNSTTERMVANLPGCKVMPDTRDDNFSIVDLNSAEIETLELLASFVRRLKPLVLVECGTYHGIAACYIGDAIAANGFGHLWTIENAEERVAVSTETIRRMELERVVTVVNGSSVTAPLHGGPYDFVFHDGDRTTVFAEELERFSGNLSKGGMSFIHDGSIRGYEHVGPMCKQFAFKHRLNHINIASNRGLDILQRP